MILTISIWLHKEWRVFWDFLRLFENVPSADPSQQNEKSLTKNKGIHILPASQLPKMAERCKNFCGPLLPTKSGSGYLKTYPVTVSRPERVEFWLRCLNRGNLTLWIRKRCFWVITTPSSGQKWQKTCFFAFFLIENHRDILELGHGNKKCLFIIFRHFMFSKQNFSFFLNF